MRRLQRASNIRRPKTCVCVSVYCECVLVLREEATAHFPNIPSTSEKQNQIRTLESRSRTVSRECLNSLSRRQFLEKDLAFRNPAGMNDRSTLERGRWSQDDSIAPNHHRRRSGGQPEAKRYQQEPNHASKPNLASTSVPPNHNFFSTAR